MSENQQGQGENEVKFTINDRIELVKHGIQLSELREDIMDLKVLFNETLRNSDYEQRLRRLEDEKIRVQTQKEDYEKHMQTQRENYEKHMQARLNTYLVMATLLAGAAATGVEFLVMKIFK